MLIWCGIGSCAAGTEVRIVPRGTPAEPVEETVATILQCGRVFDGGVRGVLQNATIVIDGERITGVTDG